MNHSTDQSSARSGATDLIASRRDWWLRAGIGVTSLAVIACFAAAFTSADHGADHGTEPAAAVQVTD
ncbi:hypothetical protein [Pseudopontixanthobacter vadosimaris]|uniref:hypothetical protein n=1 Tax=Pseudopontixanthobacter vadosimaris TaxID=2726450 RepID=UPI001473C90E|nr:hypothetical protein [Pseudopontixanthobacter vadosimaris]